MARGRSSSSGSRGAPNHSLEVDRRCSAICYPWNGLWNRVGQADGHPRRLSSKPLGALLSPVAAPFREELDAWSLVSVSLALHGLVHLLYSAQSARIFELKPGMTWPAGSWAFSNVLGDNATRTLARIPLGGPRLND